MCGTSMRWSSWGLTVTLGLGACSDDETGSNDGSSSTQAGTAEADTAEPETSQDGDGDADGDGVGDGPETTGGPMADDGNAEGSTSGAEGTSGAWPEIDLPPLSDDFEDGDFDGWEVFQPQFAELSVQAGLFRMLPARMSLWFNNTSATHVSKEVPGNFKVTSLVSARSVQNPGSPPTPQFRLGGLMARDANANAENYVFIVVGADGNDVSVETKTTQDGQSQFEGPPWPEGTGELRICRLGSTFHLLIREPGGSWILQETYDRPDLPPTLDVGPVAYANADPPDLLVTYESVDFDNVETEADCMQ